MLIFEDRNEITIQNPPTGKAVLFYDQDVLKLKDENGDIRIVTLADSIENAVSSGDYYSNSYIERLKALGSNVQYSTYLGTNTGTNLLLDNTLMLHSIYINKESTITGVGWIQVAQGSYTADNYNGIGLYSYDLLNEKLILIASTTNDGDIWKVVGSVYTTKDFTTPVVVAKGIYYIGLLYNQSAVVTPPSLLGHNSFTGMGLLMNSIGTAKFNGTVNVQNTLPSEILNTDISSQVHSGVLNLY